MHISRLSVASTNVEIRQADVDYSSIIEDALPLTLPNYPPDFSIFISQSAYSDSPINETQIGQWKQFVLRDGITYSYNPENWLYRLRVAESIDGRIDLKRATAEYRVSAPLLPRTALHLLVLDPMSLFLPGCDAMIIHGAAIARQRKAILILGYSGCGKSTLSILLSHKYPDEYQILSDDTVILDWKPLAVHAHPIKAGFGLTNQVVHDLGLDASPLNCIQQSNGKIYLRQVSNQSDEAIPISHIVFLERQSAEIGTIVHRILSREATLSHLLDSQTFLPGPYATRRLELFRTLARQAVGIHCYFPTFCDADLLHEVVNNGHA